jgi:hypothetical protein
LVTSGRDRGGRDSVGGGKVECRLDSLAGAGEAGLHGPQRDLERGGDLGLVQFGPDQQVKDIALLGGQVGEAAGERAAQPLGIEAGLGAVVRGPGVDVQPGDRPQLPDLAAPVAAGDVGRDPNSQGRASPRSRSNRPRSSKATKKVCAAASSAWRSSRRRRR